MHIISIPIIISALVNIFVWLIWLIGRSNRKDHTGEPIYLVILRMVIHYFLAICLIKYVDMPIVGAIVYGMVCIIDCVAKLEEEYYYTISENYSAFWIFANVIYIIYCTYFWIEVLAKD